MNNIFNKLNSVRFLFYISLFLFCSCTSNKVSRECDERENIVVNLQLQCAEICDGDTIVTDASYADVFLLHEKTTSVIDTLDYGTADAYGDYHFEIQNSACGLSNLTIGVRYLSARLYKKSFDFQCCDIDKDIKLILNSNETESVNLRCDSPNQKVDLGLTTLAGTPLLKYAADETIAFNSLSLFFEDSVELDLSPLYNLASRFRVDGLPLENVSEKITLHNEPLILWFFVDTDEVGSFAESIELTTTCIKENVQANTGVLQINLLAEVIDYDCTCPFVIDDKKDIWTYKNRVKTLGTVRVGRSELLEEQTILEITDDIIGEDCYFSLKGVNRYNSSVAANSLDNENPNRFAWTIQSLETLIEDNKQMQLQDHLNVSALFAPSFSGTEIVDTFEVVLESFNIYDESIGECSFIVPFIGSSCELILPAVQPLTTLLFEGRPFDNWGDYSGDDIDIATIVPFNSDKVVTQRFYSQLGSFCDPDPERRSKRELLLLIPKEEDKVKDIVYCGDLELKISILEFGDNDDTNQYSFDLESTTLLNKSDGNALDLYFEGPEPLVHFASGHTDVYSAILSIEAFLGEEMVSTQDIILETKVEYEKQKMSIAWPFFAFSQVSDLSSSPSFQAFDIKHFNSEYNYYGEVNQIYKEGDSGLVDFEVSPPTPRSTHAFFCEVDEPDNLTLRQIPKLYLVNSTLNSFSHISSLPVAKYASIDAFQEDITSLVEAMYTSDFDSRGKIAGENHFRLITDESSTNWYPQTSAIDMVEKRGLEVQKGEVYLVWNPDLGERRYETKENLFLDHCDVALLFVQSVLDGTEGITNIASITTNVAYPLNIVIKDLK